jgi:putative SOS response-associated peptidase YedK
VGTEGEGDAGPLLTFTILTTEANDAIRDIHHRMPVILEDGDHEAWLSGSVEEAASLLRPMLSERTRAFPVSTRVGNVRNDDADLVRPIELEEPVESAPPPPKQGSLF